MNLEREVATLHGIQQVEADGKFGAETAVHGLAEKFSGMSEDEVERRQLHAHVAKVEKKTVFFRNTIKTPCVVRRLAGRGRKCPASIGRPRDPGRKTAPRERAGIRRGAALREIDLP